jgi:hypothetical protein
VWRNFVPSAIDDGFAGCARFFEILVEAPPLLV